MITLSAMAATVALAAVGSIYSSWRAIRLDRARPGRETAPVILRMSYLIMQRNYPD